MKYLPADGSEYPPLDHKHIYRIYAEHSAWHSGDPAILRKTYADVPQDYRPRRYMFWTRKGATENQLDRHQVHVPLAGDIAQTSADLLFSEPPKFVIPEASQNSNAMNTEENLRELLSQVGLKNKLLEAGETCAVYGGVFLRLVWDLDYMSYPTVQVVSPDKAFATFMYGELVGVAFVEEIETEGRQGVYRHVEHHEKGKIHHALYYGTKNNFGQRVSLTRLEQTANLPEEIKLPFDSMATVYIPNQRPHRRLKGVDYGRSDFDGIEGILDGIDETWSSWLRDVRLGKSRIIVPTEYLERRGRGRGAAFDIDAEVFTALEIDPNFQGKQIDPIQFEIRDQQHKTTILELIDRAVTGAGYSPQSFGLGIEGRAESGTALKLRERKSFITQAKKQRYWTKPLQDILERLMILHNEIFGAGYQVFRPSIEWQDSVAPDPRESATVIESLHRAQSASLETKVKLLHPDFDDEQVMAEVQKIATNFQLSDVNLEVIEELD